MLHIEDLKSNKELEERVREHERLNRTKQLPYSKMSAPNFVSSCHLDFRGTDPLGQAGSSSPATPQASAKTLTPSSKTTTITTTTSTTTRRTTRSRQQLQNYQVRMSLVCMILALTLVGSNNSGVQLSLLANGAEVQQLAGNNQTTSRLSANGNDAAPLGSKTSGGGPANEKPLAAKSTSSSALESQSTDLSSMYVQIPIADPNEAVASGDNEQQQQQLVNADATGQDSDAASQSADSTKATTWTGPWPKKFQIGYIKQSDLHQVLIESLKNDPFIGSSKTSPSSPSNKSPSTQSSSSQASSSSSGKTTAVKSATTAEPPTKAPPSDAASLMAGSPQYPQLKAVQHASHMATNGAGASGNFQQFAQHPHLHQQQPPYWPSAMQPHARGARLTLPQMVMPARPAKSANLYTPAASLLLQAQHHQQLHQQQRNARHNRHFNHHLQQQQQHHHNQQQPFQMANNNHQRHPPHMMMHIDNFAPANQQQQQQHGNRYAGPQQQPQQLAVGQGSRSAYQQQQPSAKLSPVPTSTFMQQPQQQFQFVGYPSSLMKNQPVYTTLSNNFPAQQQQQQQSPIDADQMQLIQLAGVGVGSGQMQVNYGPAGPGARQQKPASADYYTSSWRPVGQSNSDESSKTSAQPSQQQQQQSNGLDSDEFDDGFEKPALIGGAGKDSSSASQSGANPADSSMNRHPALNSYLDQSSNAKASPVKVIKQQQQQGTKSSSESGGTKTSSGEGTKSASRGDDRQSDDSDQATKSVTGRRALQPQAGQSNSTTSSSGASVGGASNNATSSTTTSTTPSSLVGQQEGTTSATSSLDGQAESTTTASSLSTTGVSATTGDAGASSTTGAPSANNQTTTASTTEASASTTSATEPDGAEATTEPDSEVIDSDTTTGEQPGDQESPTTTASSLESNSRSSSSTAMPIGSSTASDSTDSEAVATQSPAQQQQSGSNSATFPAVQSEEATTATSGGREETTLNSMANPSSSSTTSATVSATVEVARGAKGSSDSLVRAGEVEGSSSSSGESGNLTQSMGIKGGDGTRTDATLSDEALMAAAVRASDVSKSRLASNGRTRSQAPAANSSSSSSSSSSTKKARSSNTGGPSERIMQASQKQTSTASTSGRKGGSTSGQQQQQQSNKLITRKPQQSSQRAAKQISQTPATKGGGVKGSTGGSGDKSAKSKKRPQAAKATKTSSGSGNGKTASQKNTRMAPAASNSGGASTSNKSDKLQLQKPSGQAISGQVVSMSAAQAQSTAQTLASLLLSRCLSSTNCAHLLDVCTTKQAAVPIDELLKASNQDNSQSSPSSSSVAPPANISAAWSLPVGLMSNNLMTLMQVLQADRVLRLFPAWRDAIEAIVDQDTQTGYTLIMPSNDAVDRMSVAQIDSLLANGEQMSQLIDNHILDSSETIELPQVGGASPAIGSSGQQQQQLSARSMAVQAQQSRYLKSKRIQVNQHRDRMVTLNGKRVVYANQLAPAGGRIHVIDGLLDWPAFGGQSDRGPAAASGRLLDIMDTLKQCDKFDGFVTLAEGTGLAQILKQDEPLTVFVPSNEALRKIPDEELEVIKNNSTALKEFIMYHIVNGSYFSQDLRDGQQLASILDMRPIQVGVRVDGCSRRLVEANTSPMRRPDIVAKNGVIHILDWYLTVRDNEWCDPIGRSQGLTSTSNAIGGTSELAKNQSRDQSSERLQQSASEPVVEVSSSFSTSSSLTSSSSSSPMTTTHSLANSVPGYATRMSLPANHKAAPTGQQQLQQMDELQSQASSIKPTSKLPSELSDQRHSVYVSAVPLNDVVQLP